MRLVPDSGTRALQGSRQWLQCRHDGTAGVDDFVQLETVPPVSPAPGDGDDFTGGYAGLAFDRHCRLFHARPEVPGIEFVFWDRVGPLGVHDDPPHPFEFTGSDAVAAGALPARPLALAADGADFLYVADPDGSAVWLVGTWQQEVARRVEFASPPLDLAASGDAVYVLLADGTTWQIAPCDAPERTAWPAVAGAVRFAVGPEADGRPVAWVLAAAGTSNAELHSLRTGQSIPAAYCTDLLIDPELSADGAHVLVLAQRPGEEFRRLQIAGVQATALTGLIAPHYDGRGVEWTPSPDRRVVYWTGRGLRHAAPARGRYRTDGRLFGIALDSEHDQSRWGRLTVEACVPEGTRIRFWAFTRDDLEFTDPFGGAAAEGVPPVVSQHTWAQRATEPQALHRDPSQRPLAPAPSGGFTSHDAPVIAPPGRYLWLVFLLEGTHGRSPRLRAARVEFPGHALLGLLPRTLWREAAAREFLFRYLAPLVAVLDEWEAVGAHRHRLLDARIAPPEALPWLARFVGLVLDPCWPQAVQRRMILEAAALFRGRGTLTSLQRMLEILTDSQVIVIEQFRLRGGGVVGNPQSVASQAVLGGGYRVGGRIGEPGTATIEGAQEPSFDDFAHRFTVTIVAVLDDARMACVRRLIEEHKPAHTAFTLCTAESGVRAGVGSHVGISSVIGDSGGFVPAVAGDAALGAGFVLGRPALDPQEPA